MRQGKFTAETPGPLDHQTVEDVTALLHCRECVETPWRATLWASPDRPAVTVCGGCGSVLMVWP